MADYMQQETTDSRLSIKRFEYLWGDYYEGTKEDLIAAGVCRSEWFPRAPVVWRNGKHKRRFGVADGVRLVDLHPRKKWSVAIDVDEEEQERRREARREERRQEETAKVRALPPFVPGSMTEAEKHHMRMLRGLSEDRREVLQAFTESLFASDTESRQQKRPLRLVVDNGGRHD